MILSALLLASSCAAPPAPSQIPYRQFTPQIDGNPREWREPWLERRFVETAGLEAQRNHVRVRVAWDADALLFAVEIIDRELIAAPAGLVVDQFHQYDSAQIYLDSRANASLAMDDDDIDLLLLPDGRSGVLRGDALIGALSQAAVPQRESKPLALDYAARRNPRGWDFELRVPFAALGVDARAGSRLGMDVVINDWLVDHPPGAVEGFTPDRIRALADAAPSRPDTDPAVGTQLLPRNWSGETDFGYPQRWAQLSLTGEPPMLERWSRRWGVAPVLTAIGVAGLLFGVLCAGLTYLWHRRLLRGVLARLAHVPPTQSDAFAGGGSALRADAVAVGIGERHQAREPALEVAEPPIAPDPPERAFAEAVLTHVRAHLADDLSPPVLAEQFHVSIRTLQRRLLAGLGSSPQDLVLAARLEAARTMLRAGNRRVGDVASAVGFEDLSHFSRRYRQAFGHPPSSE